MPDLRQTRKKLQTTLLIMAGIDVLAGILYFSPVIGSPESRRMDLNRLQADLTTKTRQVAPLKDLPQKVVLANKQIAGFYKDRFPTQQSQVLTEFGKLTSANGVKIEQGQIKPADTVTNGLQQLEMQYQLSGSYTSLAKFINAVERDQMFFIIDSVTLGGEQQGPVKLAVQMETFLKVGT